MDEPEIPISGTLARQLCIALNDRDSYGTVVSRLIEWFADGENGDFQIEDYQAIMMDAGLMGREDYQLTEAAKKLFRSLNPPDHPSNRPPSEHEGSSEDT